MKSNSSGGTQLLGSSLCLRGPRDLQGLQVLLDGSTKRKEHGIRRTAVGTPGSTAKQLCDLRQVTQAFCVSVSSHKIKMVTIILISLFPPLTFCDYDLSTTPCHLILLSEVLKPFLCFDVDLDFCWLRLNLLPVLGGTSQPWLHGSPCLFLPWFHWRAYLCPCTPACGAWQSHIFLTWLPGRHLWGRPATPRAALGLGGEMGHAAELVQRKASSGGDHPLGSTQRGGSGEVSSVSPPLPGSEEEVITVCCPVQS